MSRVPSGREQKGKLCPRGTWSGYNLLNVAMRTWTSYWVLKKQQSRSTVDALAPNHVQKMASYLKINIEEGAAETSGYTPVPAMLQGCWGGCSPRRQMSLIHGDKHILSIATPSKFTMLSLWLFLNYWVDGKLSCNGKATHLKPEYCLF